MTALILAVKRQADRTIHSPKRINVIMLLLVAIAALGFALLFNAAPNSVLYNNDAITLVRPAETEVCIGGQVHFSTITEATTDQLPGRLEIDEAWCLEGLGGACKTVPAPNPRFPLLEPKRIVTPRVSRDVPEILTPGTYHFWHTATDTRGNVTGYIVAPIKVEACETP